MLKFVGVVIGAAALQLSARAQVVDYPAKPVRMVVPFSAGSPIEVPARAVAQQVQQALGQPFVFEYRVGASGTIGTEHVARAPRDGYTMLVTNCSHSSNVSHYKKLPYDSVTDFSPITQINATFGNIVAVHPSVPARSVKELIALAKARPGQMNYASAGIGSPPHVTAALFMSLAGIDVVHVPYKGTAVAFTDFVAGQVEIMAVSSQFIVSYVKAGRVRPLGIGGPRRLPALPDVPTLHEAGFEGFDLTCYHGMWFPSGVPAEITRRLQAEVAKALALPEVRRHFADNVLIPVGSTPEEFAAFIKNNIALHAGVARKIGIQPQ